VNRGGGSIKREFTNMNDKIIIPVKNKRIEIVVLFLKKIL